MTPLSILWQLHRFNLADDGFGNLTIVYADSWSAAHYFAYSL